MRKLLTVLLVSVLAAGAATTALAQGGLTGAITGTVQDANGGVIAKATVAVYSLATGAKVREVTTSEAGTFSVPLLPPGTYKLEITATGFAKYVADRVEVRVTETSSVVPTMKVGQVTETVTVTEAVTPVQLASAATGETIGTTTVSTLPLSTRNFFALLTLSAGTNTELFDSAALGRGLVTINVNGQRPTNNNYQLEGINANDVNLPILDNVALPNPQTVLEFKTQTSLYDASQGRNGGGNVQVALKSGTDHYHGDLYEFFRNDDLNANDFFFNRSGVSRPVLRQNQFGGSLGGPIPLGKQFFFYGNYQGTRATSGIANGTLLQTGIPALPTNRSAANLQSIFFPGGLAALGNICGIGGNQPCTQLDQVALNFLNLPASKCPSFGDPTFCIPSLGTPGITGTSTNAANIFRSAIGNFFENQFTASADKQLTSKDKLTGRWFFSDFRSLQPFGGGSSLAFAKKFPNTNRFLKLGWTRTVSSSTVNDFRFGLNRFTFSTIPSEPISLTDIGAVRANSADFPAAYRITIAGIAGAPAGGVFSLGTQQNDDRGGSFNTFVWGDDLSYQRGKHVFRLGFETSRYQLNRFNRFATRGSVSFTASNNQTAFQNFLLGRIASTQAAAGFFTFHFRATDYGAYIQDDWKFTPRLTVNLGLRWEGLSVAHERDNFLSNFRGLNDGQPGPISIIHPEATAKVGTPGVSSCTLLDCLRNTFAPRVGFAWDTFGNQRTVVRGGFGMYYQRTSNQPLLQTSGGLPFSQAISAAAFSVSMQNPIPSILPTSAFPLPFDQVVPALTGFNGSTGAPIFQSANGGPLSGFFFFPVRNFKPPYAEQWNLSVQRQVFKGWVLEVGYVGTHGVRLLGPGGPDNAGTICTTARPCVIPPQIGSNVNVPAGTPFVTKNADGSISITGSTAANINARVPVQFLGLATSRGRFGREDGNSIYHGLQTTLSHQFSNGLYFQGAYTWSKNIDNSSGSAFGDELNGLRVYGDYFDPASNRARSDFDRTHRLVVSYNYELPIGKWLGITGGGLGRIVNGWSINGVTTFQSGNPVTIFDSSAVTLQDTQFIETTNFPTLVPGATIASVNRSGSVKDRLNNYFDLTKFFPGGLCVNNQNAVVTPTVSSTDPACAAALGLPVGTPTFAAVGNIGRNVFRGPFQQNWDMSLVKHTKVMEFVDVELRAEFFNVWNHPSFNSPGVGPLGSVFGNLGQIDVSGLTSPIVSTVNRPRIIQFALKINY